MAAESNGSVVTVPVDLFHAMAACYYGSGPRRGEQSVVAPGLQGNRRMRVSEAEVAKEIQRLTQTGPNGLVPAGAAADEGN
jgi:hypothetical protein